MGASAISGPKNLQFLPLSSISPDRANNPRQTFDDESLADLVASIRRRGLKTPLRVRPVGNKFVLLAGERRYRALQIATCKKVSCFVQSALEDPAEIICEQLIDDTHFQELNPIERAKSFQRLKDLKGWSASQIADNLQIKVKRVIDSLALLELAEPLQEQVRDGQLAAGAGRAIAKLRKTEDQQSVGARAVREDLGVRAVESIVERVTNGGKRRRRQTPARTRKSFWPNRSSRVTVRSTKALDPLSTVRTLQAALAEAMRDLLSERGLQQEFHISTKELLALLDSLQANAQVEGELTGPLNQLGIILFAELFALTRSDEPRVSGEVRSFLNDVPARIRQLVGQMRRK